MNIKTFIPSLYQLQSPSLIPERPTSTTLDMLAQYLQYLQTDIQLLHRDLTYWDIYKINYVIKDVKEYNSIVNNLLPGQTAVIGFEESQMINGVRKSRGDLIIRLLDDTLFEIRSLSSGIYEPYQFENGLWYFNYTNDTPQESDPPITVQVTAQTPNNIYGQSQDVNATTSFTFPQHYWEDENSNKHYLDIKPIIRFYTPSYEIIEIPFNISLTAHEWTVTWTANNLVNYIQVK